MTFQDIQGDGDSTEVTDYIASDRVAILKSVLNRTVLIDHR